MPECIVAKPITMTVCGIPFYDFQVTGILLVNGLMIVMKLRKVTISFTG